MSDPATADTRQYVLFRLRDEEYGLPISAVRSIIRHEVPTPVPGAPAEVEGVFNLRGQVIPLIDLGQHLLSDALVVTDAARVIVAETSYGPVGLAVDCVREVANIAVADIRPVPAAALATETADAFEGVAPYGDRLLILLDPEKALPRPVFASAAALTGDGDDA